MRSEGDGGGGVEKMEAEGGDGDGGGGEKKDAEGLVHDKNDWPYFIPIENRYLSNLSYCVPLKTSFSIDVHDCKLRNIIIFF